MSKRVTGMTHTPESPYIVYHLHRALYPDYYCPLAQFRQTYRVCIHQKTIKKEDHKQTCGKDLKQRETPVNNDQANIIFIETK